MRGDGRIYRRQRTHWISYYRHGVEYRESAHCRCPAEAPEAVCKDATRRLRQRLAQVRTGTFLEPRTERTTVDDLIAAYLAHCVTRGKKSVQLAGQDAHGAPVYRGQTPATIAHVRAAFAGWRAVDVTDEAVERLANTWTAAGAAPGTIVLRLAYLRSAFLLGLRRRRIPADAVPHIPAIEVRNARQGFFEAEEFWALHAALGDPLADMAHFAYVTGWRASEVRGLTWATVDREAREIRLPDSKNGRPRVLPIAGELGGLIDRRWRVRALGCAFVFHRAGAPMAQHTMCDQWRRASLKVGLGDRNFHDLRRTAYRNLLARGVDSFTAMDVCGHKTVSMAKRYAIGNVQGMAAALERVAAR